MYGMQVPQREFAVAALDVQRTASGNNKTLFTELVGRIAFYHSAVYVSCLLMAVVELVALHGQLCANAKRNP